MASETDDYSRLHRIFERLRDLSSQERASALDEVSQQDPDLIDEVLGLLEEYDSTEPDLFSETQLALSRGALERLVTPEAGSSEEPETWLPANIGPYRVQKQLGAGGMGVVYLAIQDSPRREVAIKVLHPMQASVERRSRLRNEAELLGRLRHAGIAQVHDAGVYDLGRGSQPYFAMEYVQGADLKSHCELHCLDLEQRIRILVRVCAAVHYAHGKGIIHRDLKPDNILVDQEGQPKILDFGIARANAPSTVMSTIFTEDSQLMGTLSYMAPELLRGMTASASPRIDVYALGVIAFELATERLPHDTGQMSISVAIALLANTDAPLAGRIRPALKGDLETILAKALSSEQQHRYASAQELGDDLQAYLQHRPIQARKPSSLYRAWKFSRRHRGLVAGAVATVLSLVLGLVLALYLRAQEHQQRTRADASATEARRSQVKIVASLMAEARALLASGKPWDSLRLLEDVPTENRDWGWRLLRSRLPRLLDLPSDLPEYSSAPFPFRPRWRFLGEDHLYGLDQARNLVRLVPLGEGEESSVFQGQDLLSLGIATATGWLVGRTQDEVLLLNLWSGLVAQRWAAQPLEIDESQVLPRALYQEPGHASSDGMVVVLVIDEQSAEVWSGQEKLADLDLGLLGNSPVQPHCRVRPDGSEVLVNRLTEFAVLDVASGRREVVRAPDGADRLLAYPVPQGFAGLHWNASKRQRYGLQVAASASGLGQGAPPLRVHHHEPNLQTSETSSLLATGEPGFIELWEDLQAPPADVIATTAPTASTAAEPYRFAGPSAYQLTPEISPAGTRMLVIGMDGGKPWLIDLEQGLPRAGAASVQRHSAPSGGINYHLALSSDGSMLAVLSPGEPKVQILDMETLEPLHTFQRAVHEPLSRDALLAFSPDDGRLYATTPMPDHEGVQLVSWDLATGEASVESPPQPIRRGNHAPLLDPFLERFQTGPRTRLSQKAQMVGERAWTAWNTYEHWGFDRFQGAEDGERYSVLLPSGDRRRKSCLGLAAHPREALLAMLTIDVVAVGSYANESLLGLYPLGAEQALRQAAVPGIARCVAWSPDGEQLCLGMDDGYLTIVDAVDLSVRHRIPGRNRHYIYGVIWHPDGERIISCGGDHQVTIWEPSSDE